MTDAEIIIQLAKCWNNLDTSYLNQILDENMVYDSQWVFTSIKDKETYITYLSGKFATIRNQASSKPNASFAYYGDIENNSGAPCLILSQHNSEFLLLIKIKDQKIFKMDLCMIPMAKEAINFDWSPY